MQETVKYFVTERMRIVNLTTFGPFQITVLKMSSIATRVENVFQLPTNVTTS
jgi:hypothetical protein